MDKVTEKTEGLSFKLTSQEGIRKDREVQIAVAGPDGTYKQRFEINEGETKWISLPFKLVNGCLVMA